MIKEIKKDSYAFTSTDVHVRVSKAPVWRPGPLWRKGTAQSFSFSDGGKFGVSLGGSRGGCYGRTGEKKREEKKKKRKRKEKETKTALNSLSGVLCFVVLIEQ